MTDRERTERRILVIVNRTCPCPTLADELAGRASDARLDVLVVGPALNSRFRHRVSDVITHLVSNYGLVEEGRAA